MRIAWKDSILRAVCFMEFMLAAYSGKGAVRGRYADAMGRRMSVPVRDPTRPEYFLCNTTTCAMRENFYVIKGTDDDYDNYTCPDALGAAITTFGTLAAQQCRITAKEKILWHACKPSYCQMYENFGKAVIRGERYHGEDCRPILNFNHSICNYWYRDADDFCGCICPALALLETTKACETRILEYFLLGRRSPSLIAKYYIDGYCLSQFCEWISKIADPRYQHKDAPVGCLAAALPFQKSQCQALMRTTKARPPYRPCPWEQATSQDYILNCTDGSGCDVRSDTWACCSRHGYRAQCPKNFPVMCADPLECVGDTDHCCVEIPEFCSSGVRSCTPLMATSLPEWVGGVPAHVPAYVGPPTTMNPIEYAGWLSRQPKPTERPSSWGEDVLPYFLYIAIPIIVSFVLCSCIITYWFGWKAVSQVTKELLGSSRFMALYQKDIVHVFKPDEKPKEYPPLPPKISDEEILRRMHDAAACEALEDSCRAAFRYGRSHLVLVHFAQGYGPVEEAQDLEQAIDAVYRRGLQDVGNNRRLIKEGETFVQTFAMETMLVNSMEKAFPSLEVDWKNLAAPPVPGKPWQGTTIGNVALSAARNEAWRMIEDLTSDIKVAREGGASHGLCHEAQKLVADLVARTPELPADRCVLDPEGQGVKLLPRGKQRALWTHTGETYMYDTATQQAGELEDFELPPGEELGGVSVDAAKPVCAHWAKAGNCKLGRRCPWRHCKPVAGDSIREPICF